VSLHVLQRVEIPEVAICQGLVGQWPQTFRRLPFGRIRWEEVPVHPGGSLPLRACRPTRPVEPQADLRRRPGPHGLGTRCESNRERGNRHGRQPQPHGPAGRGVPEGIAVAPVVAGLDDRFRPLPAAAPLTPQERLEAQAMWIGSPQRDRVLRVCLLHRLDYGGALFLKAAWASGSALAWRGRGTWGVKPTRRSISQPRGGYPGRPRVAAIQAATVGPVQRPPSGGGWSRALARAGR
jgi:hypothetical protein